MAKIIYYIAFSIIGACSASNPLARIVRGNLGDIKDFPYLVSIRRSDSKQKISFEHKCGGAIIDENHILTAAHCFVDPYWEEQIPFSEFTIHADTSTLDSSGSVYTIKNLNMHPNYDTEYLKNDIAVIRLIKSMVFNNKIKKVELPSHNFENGMVGAIAGWGHTKGLRDVVSNNLQKMTQTLMDHAKCNVFINATELTDTQICGFNDTVQEVKRTRKLYAGLCQGDSGSPIVVDNKVVGIASHVIRKCAGGLPDVYTNVYSFLDFIKESIMS